MKLRTGVALVGLASVGVAAAVGYGLLRQVTPIFQPDECTATVDDRTVTLDLEQAENAALITAVAVDRGMPARAATIALATAYQESKLYNLESGDRDSLGLFQQRPSQGWGSREQVLDPYYATNAFYNALTKLDGYQKMRVTVAAQRVQRSGFPEAYADHEADARVLASALSGNSPHTFSCRLGGTPDEASSRLRKSGLTLARMSCAARSMRSSTDRRSAGSLPAASRAATWRARPTTRAGPWTSSYGRSTG